MQFRDKGVYTPEERSEAARGVRSLCDRHDVPFLVNDDPELARRFRADGVHVGRQDPSPRTARGVLGPRAIVGVTVYGNAGEEEAAAAAGADYLAVGPFSPSPTKPRRTRAVSRSTASPESRSSPRSWTRPIRAGQRRRFGGPSMRADAPDPPRARTHGKRAREESLIDDIGQQTIK